MKKLNVTLMMLSVFALSAVTAAAQSDTIQVDTGLFISEINTWLPMALSIAAIGVGISGAFALSMFVGRLIVNALQGRMGS